MADPKIHDMREALMLARTTDGRLVRRPLSPHLQIYRPQISSVLSIMNRVTGIAVSIGTLMLVIWLMAAATGPQSFDRVQSFLGSPLGLFMLFGWTAALLYHFFAGLRHLAWDAGWGFELERMHRTGWLVVGATLVCTTLLWVAGLIVLRS